MMKNLLIATSICLMISAVVMAERPKISVTPISVPTPDLTVVNPPVNIGVQDIPVPDSQNVVIDPIQVIGLPVNEIEFANVGNLTPELSAVFINQMSELLLAQNQDLISVTIKRLAIADQQVAASVLEALAANNVQVVITTLSNLSASNSEITASLLQALSTKNASLVIQVFNNLNTQDADLGAYVLQKLAMTNPEMARGLLANLKIEKLSRYQAVMLSLSVGDESALAALQSIGITKPAPYGLPTWFLGMGQHFAVDATLRAATHTIKQITLSSTRRDLEAYALDWLAALREGDKYIVVCDLTNLPPSAILLLSDTRCMAVVVGHYLGATHPDTYAEEAEKVTDRVAMIRRVSGAPVLLSVSILAEVKRGSGWTADYEKAREWPAAFNLDIFDGFAVYNLIFFSAFESPKRQWTRNHLVLPDKPMILLEVTGTGWRSTDESIKTIWQNKLGGFVDRLKQDQWRGVIVQNLGGQDWNVKIPIINSLKPEQKFEE